METVILKLSNAIESDFKVFNRHLRSYADPKTLEVTYRYDFKEMAADKEFVNTFSRLSYHWRGYVYFMKRMEMDANKLKEELSRSIENHSYNR